MNKKLRDLLDKTLCAHVSRVTNNNIKYNKGKVLYNGKYVQLTEALRTKMRKLLEM